MQGAVTKERCTWLFSGQELHVKRVHIGTTHLLNAVVQRTGLRQVAVLRLCGPATVTLPPFVDFPPDLKTVSILVRALFLTVGLMSSIQVTFSL